MSISGMDSGTKKKIIMSRNLTAIKALNKESHAPLSNLKKKANTTILSRNLKLMEMPTISKKKNTKISLQAIILELIRMYKKDKRKIN
jgi:hypothetical protein